MTILQKGKLLAIFIANVIALNACSNSEAKNNQIATNNTSKQKAETTQQPEQKSNSSLQTELDNAKKAGKAVFVVVTGTGVTNTDKATTIASGANAIYKNAVVVQMNRDDAANAKLVTDWRLAGAPLPVILVLSSKGQPTGGYILEQATAENIAALVPSPKLEQVYDAVGKSKHAIVVFTKDSFTDKAEVIKIAKDAVSKLNDEAVFIEVDMDDSKEDGFMSQLRISKLTTQASVTLVINKQGQVAGTSNTVPDAAKLVAAANAPVKSGCGPGCGPAGCGK